MIGKKWIVFDVDGTLLDFAAAERHALRLMLKERGHVYGDDLERRYREINGRLWGQFEAGKISSLELRSRRFEELAASAGIKDNPVEMGRIYLERLGERSDLIAGAVEVVESLKERSRLAIATNGIAQVQRNRLARSPWNGAFDPIVISEEVGFAKPASGFFEALFAAMGGPSKEEVVIVGDSLSSDIAGGAGFGITTCWFNPEARVNHSGVRPDFEIRALGEVLTLGSEPKARGASGSSSHQP